jgi:hypothetical protein
MKVQIRFSICFSSLNAIPFFIPDANFKHERMRRNCALYLYIYRSACQYNYYTSTEIYVRKYSKLVRSLEHRRFTCVLDAGRPRMYRPQFFFLLGYECVPWTCTVPDVFNKFRR